MRFDALDSFDSSMELVLMAGGGFNGTRQWSATMKTAPDIWDDFEITGAGIGDGGFLANRERHIVVGGGVRAIIRDRITVRLEERSYVSFTEYDEDDDLVPEPHNIWTHFLHVGVGAVF